MALWEWERRMVWNAAMTGRGHGCLPRSRSFGPTPIRLCLTFTDSAQTCAAGAAAACSGPPGWTDGRSGAAGTVTVGGLPPVAPGWRP